MIFKKVKSENPKHQEEKKPQVSLSFKDGPNFSGWINDNEPVPDEIEPEPTVGETIKRGRVRKGFFKLNIWSVDRFNGWFSAYYGFSAPSKSIDLRGYGDKGQKASDQLLDRLCDVGIIGRLVKRLDGLTKGSEKWEDIFDLIEDMTAETFKEIKENKK